MKRKQCLAVLLTGAMAFSPYTVAVQAEDITTVCTDNADSVASEEDSVSSGALSVYAVQEGIYSVPVRMANAAKPENDSMGNGALDGDAVITVNADGTSTIDLSFKSVTYTGLYGHLLKLWAYPVSEEMDYSWWDDSEFETLAEVIDYMSDYGLSYTDGDTTKYDFVHTVRITRPIDKEDIMYIRISVDAMAGFDQVARLEFDWDNAKPYEKTTESTTESTTETTTESTTESTTEATTDTTTEATTEATTDTTTETTTEVATDIITETTTDTVTETTTEVSTETTTEVSTETTTEITTEATTEAVTELISLSAPVVTAEKSSAQNNEKVKITISTEDSGVRIYYTTDGSQPTRSSKLYTVPFGLTGQNGTVKVRAAAFSENVVSDEGSCEVRFIGSSASSTKTYEDGKYWMNFNLWNASSDQASMGDAAFENNRQALVTISGDTAHVQIATNPVAVSGYTSAMQDIKSDAVLISIDDTDSFTTNTRYDGSTHKFDYVSLFSFDISDLSTEYVPVQICVPYTPMDGIAANDGGYLDARLKLDFSSMTATDAHDSLSPNSNTAVGSTSSSTTTEAVNLTDEDTGIRLEADEYAFSSGTDFEIEQLTEGNDYEVAKSVLGVDDFTLYSLTAKYYDDEVDPNGTATVYIPVKEGMTLYRINKGDANTEAGKTVLEYELSNDEAYYVIEVKEFGLFALAPTEEESTEDELTEDVLAPDLDYAVDDAAEDEIFNDIADCYAKDDIIYSAKLGLFSGVGNGAFAPNGKVTRAMFVTVLARLAGEENHAVTDNFTDVKADDYFAGAVSWAKDNGIVSGVSNTRFAPAEIITREQMAVMLSGYIKYKGITLKNEVRASFTDEDSISPWARESVESLVRAGIMNGNTDGSFAPKAASTRAEAATLIAGFVRATEGK